MATSYPVFILAKHVAERGALGTGSLKRRFLDSSKVATCSYCVCLRRSVAADAKGSDKLVCDRLLKGTIEAKYVGLNCEYGSKHVYRYSDDADLVPYQSVPQMEGSH